MLPLHHPFYIEFNANLSQPSENYLQLLLFLFVRSIFVIEASISYDSLSVALSFYRWIVCEFDRKTIVPLPSLSQRLIP